METNKFKFKCLMETASNRHSDEVGETCAYGTGENTLLMYVCNYSKSLNTSVLSLISITALYCTYVSYANDTLSM